MQNQAGTLELINAELAARLDRQADASDKIDTKAVVLAGYVVAAASFLATQHSQAVLASIAYAAYIATFGLNVLVYAVGAHGDVPDPRGLFNNYAGRTKAEVLAALAATRVRAFDYNARQSRRRALLWRASLASLAVGVMFMVLSVAVHTSPHDSVPRPARSAAPSASSAASHS
jgi:hypothetical protein